MLILRLAGFQLLVSIRYCGSDRPLHHLLLRRTWYSIYLGNSPHLNAVMAHRVRRRLSADDSITFVVSVLHPGAVTAPLSTEIFVQSDRMAAFALLGIERWLLVAVLGLVFPFLIVSATSLKISCRLYNINYTSCFEDQHTTIFGYVDVFYMPGCS